MAKAPRKLTGKQVPVTKTVPKKLPSVDDRLSEHLKQAEDHLIEAVKLFSGPLRPSRRLGYYDRLSRAQEAITGLYREELVRIRGPISRRGTK